MHRVIIIGNHPIAPHLIAQYATLGREVHHQEQFPSTGSEIEMNQYDELVLLPPAELGTSPLMADNAAISLLSQVVPSYQPEAHSENRLLCHLLLQEWATLRVLQAFDFENTIREKADIYPFTMNEVWCRKIRLDWHPISVQTELQAHLVIIGTGDIAEIAAIHAAHTAHFPNYVRNHTLRTRITIIDEGVTAWAEQLLTQYKYLFRHSFYRRIHPSLNPMQQLFHQPEKYTPAGEFVDIEWEFVDASVRHPVVKAKLNGWARARSQLLTMVLAHEDESPNFNEAIYLHDELADTPTPIYVYMHDDSILRKTDLQRRANNLIPFGMLDRGYDVTLPLVRMAKNVNHIYDLCYADNDAEWTGHMQYAVEMDESMREASWARLPAIKRTSSLYCAMTVGIKMRSIGLDEDAWQRFHDIPQQQIELLAEVEHNRWSVEELILGWRPCTAEEEKMVEADISQKEMLKKHKVHYDLRPYRDLRPDQTDKPVAMYDLYICASLPLIVKDVERMTNDEGSALPAGTLRLR